MTHLAIHVVTALLAAPAATSDDGTEKSDGLPLLFIAFAFVFVAFSLYEALWSPAAPAVTAVQSALVPSSDFDLRIVTAREASLH